MIYDFLFSFILKCTHKSHYNNLICISLTLVNITAYKLINKYMKIMGVLKRGVIRGFFYSCNTMCDKTFEWLLH